MVNKRSRERSANPAGGPAGDRDRVAGDQPDQPLDSPANPNSRSLGATAQTAIEKHWAKAGRHEAAVLKDQDPEELHQMRVALRRLRSAIVGFAVAIDLPKRASERAVGQVARILGELRDLDVMDEALRDRYLQNLPPEEQPLLQTVREELAGQRQKAFGRVSKTLQKREWPAINTALGR